MLLKWFRCLASMVLGFLLAAFYLASDTPAGAHDMRISVAALGELDPDVALRNSIVSKRLGEYHGALSRDFMVAVTL